MVGKGFLWGVQVQSCVPGLGLDAGYPGAQGDHLEALVRGVDGDLLGPDVVDDGEGGNDEYAAGLEVDHEVDGDPGVVGGDHVLSGEEEP